MAQNLPSLPSLRSFEASARLESFSKAARELNLTQAAISQQIRGLEDRIGGALFRRVGRRVALTELGKLYLGMSANAVREMEVAFETARALARPEALVVKTTPTFASYWLMPRLRYFQQLWPSASLTVTAVELNGQTTSLGDLVITTGKEDWTGFRARKLFDVNLVAVAAPDVAKGLDLARFRSGHADGIIHTLKRLDDWSIWCRGAGFPAFSLDRGTILFNSALSYAAAQQGAGIVVAEEAMVAEQLARGDLVRVHAARVPTARGYYLIEPDQPRRPIVSAFVDWLEGVVAEAATDTQKPWVERSP